MSRRPRTKAKKPPLSRLDMGIYVALIILAFALMLFLMASLILIPRRIGFADDGVVAATESAAFFALSFPLATVLALGISIPAGKAIDEKQPIFGNKKFKPKWGDPVINTFPIFSKEFKQYVYPKKKKTIKMTVIILSILLAVSAIIYPLGIFPRQTLTEDHVFSTYNSFNRATHTAEIEDAEKMVISIDSARRSHRCSIQITFVFGETKYYFGVGSFEKMDTEEALRYMLTLKSYFANGRYEIEHIDSMDRLISDRNYNTTETALVYELFNYKK